METLIFLIIFSTTTLVVVNNQDTHAKVRREYIDDDLIRHEVRDNRGKRVCYEDLSEMPPEWHCWNETN